MWQQPSASPSCRKSCWPAGRAPREWVTGQSGSTSYHRRKALGGRCLSLTYQSWTRFDICGSIWGSSRWTSPAALVTSLDIGIMQETDDRSSLSAGKDMDSGGSEVFSKNKCEFWLLLFQCYFNLFITFMNTFTFTHTQKNKHLLQLLKGLLSYSTIHICFFF